MSTPYEDLKTLQHAIRLERGRKPPVKDLLVLSPQNDPFYAGSDGEREMAEWFAGLWERFGYTTGVHLRRVHYRILSEGTILRPDGSLYANNRTCWDWMNRASRHARYLGLIDPEDLIDKRNPTPHIHLAPGVEAGPAWDYELRREELDRLHPVLSNGWRNLASVETFVYGYDYEEALQPYHVEVWAEKTTMDDILVPLCGRTGVNYVSGAGYQSITSMVQLLRERVAQLRKPCRVLYISDYDEAGQNMPRQMARQMEFWIRQYAANCDVRVEPIVMTAEQAARYPPAPDSGAVELDAMEAIEPGKLGRIVRENIMQFRDTRLAREVHERAVAAREAVESAVDEAIEDELEVLEDLKTEAEGVYGRYRARLEALAAELDAELEPLDQRLETLQHTRLRKSSRTSSSPCRRCRSRRQARTMRDGFSTAAGTTSSSSGTTSAGVRSFAASSHSPAPIRLARRGPLSCCTRTLTRNTGPSSPGVPTVPERQKHI